FSDKFGILCKFISIALELNTGKSFESRKSECLTILNFGCFLFNHSGICPHVTKCILFTQGVYFSTPLNQKCKLSQYLNLILLLSPDFLICNFSFSAFHSGSFPSTHIITKSMSFGIVSPFPHITSSKIYSL